MHNYYFTNLATFVFVILDVYGQLIPSTFSLENWKNKSVVFSFGCRVEKMFNITQVVITLLSPQLKRIVSAI